MRVALAIAMATLTLGLASQPMHGQVPSAGAPPLETRQIYTIHMVDAQSGWAYGGGILRSTDGGTNWRDVTPPNSSGRGFANITALSPLVAWVIRYSTNRSTFEITFEIFRTADGGRTWRSAAIPGPSVTWISFINPREGWVLGSFGAAAVKEHVGIYRSTDGGETWISVGPEGGLPFEGDKGSLTFVNSTTGWITGIDLQYESLYLYVTHDGGRTWGRQSMPIPRQLMPHWMVAPQPPKFFTAQDGTLLTFYDLYDDSGGHNGRVVVLYATHDGGNTWTHTTPVAVSKSETPYYAVADMDHAWVTAGGVLQATRDGGRHWAPLPRNPLFAIPTNHTNPYMSPPVAQLDFISPEVGWAVRYARDFPASPTPPFLLKTLDGGRTWSPLSYSILRQ